MLGAGLLPSAREGADGAVLHLRRRTNPMRSVDGVVLRTTNEARTRSLGTEWLGAPSSLATTGQRLFGSWVLCPSDRDVLRPAVLQSIAAGGSAEASP